MHITTNAGKSDLFQAWVCFSVGTAVIRVIYRPNSISPAVSRVAWQGKHGCWPSGSKCEPKIISRFVLKKSVKCYLWNNRVINHTLSLSLDDHFVKCLMWYFQGSILNDCCCVCCCTACVMCQLSREHDFVTSQALTYWWQSNTLCVLWFLYLTDSIICQYYSNIRPCSLIPDIGNLNALNSPFLFVLFSWINYPLEKLTIPNVLQ